MDLKKISELFGIVVPPLFLCAYIRLVTYYGHWGVPILDYLSPSELLLSFIHPGLVLMCLAGLYFLSTLALGGVALAWLKLREPKAGKTAVSAPADAAAPPSDGPKAAPILSPTKARSRKWFGWLRNIAMGGFMAYGFYLMARDAWFEHAILPLVVGHSVLWVFAIAVAKKAMPASKGKNPIPMLIGTILTLISASYFFGRHEARKTSDGSAYHKIWLSDGAVLETGPELVYLGKTNDFLLLFERPRRQVIVIPVAELKTMRFRPPRD